MSGRLQGCPHLPLALPLARPVPRAAHPAALPGGDHPADRRDMDPAPARDDPTERWRRIVAEVATMPGVVERLTAEHTPDRHGRCRVCTVAGQGVAWPCTLSVLAAEAAEVRQRRR